MDNLSETVYLVERIEINPNNDDELYKMDPINGHIDYIRSKIPTILCPFGDENINHILNSNRT